MRGWNPLFLRSYKKGTNSKKVKDLKEYFIFSRSKPTLKNRNGSFKKTPRILQEMDHFPIRSDPLPKLNSYKAHFSSQFSLSDSSMSLPEDAIIPFKHWYFSSLRPHSNQPLDRPSLSHSSDSLNHFSGGSAYVVIKLLTLMSFMVI